MTVAQLLLVAAASAALLADGAEVCPPQPNVRAAVLGGSCTTAPITYASIASYDPAQQRAVCQQGARCSQGGSCIASELAKYGFDRVVSRLFAPLKLLELWGRNCTDEESGTAVQALCRFPNQAALVTELRDLNVYPLWSSLTPPELTCAAVPNSAPTSYECRFPSSGATLSPVRTSDTAPLSQPCLRDQECSGPVPTCSDNGMCMYRFAAPGAICAPTNGLEFDQCQRGRCDAEYNMCPKFVQIGQSCGRPRGEYVVCAGSVEDVVLDGAPPRPVTSFCDTTATPPLCRAMPAQVGLGASCETMPGRLPGESLPACAPALLCDSGTQTCAPRVSLGGSCSLAGTLSECAPGLYCNSSRLCAAQVARGELCPRSQAADVVCAPVGDKPASCVSIIVDATTSELEARCHLPGSVASGKSFVASPFNDIDERFCASGIARVAPAPAPIGQLAECLPAVASGTCNVTAFRSGEGTPGYDCWCAKRDAANGDDGILVPTTEIMNRALFTSPTERELRVTSPSDLCRGALNALVTGGSESVAMGPRRAELLQAAVPAEAVWSIAYRFSGAPGLGLTLAQSPDSAEAREWIDVCTTHLRDICAYRNARGGGWQLNSWCGGSSPAEEGLEAWAVGLIVTGSVLACCLLCVCLPLLLWHKGLLRCPRRAPAGDAGQELARDDGKLEDGGPSLASATGPRSLHSMPPPPPPRVGLPHHSEGTAHPSGQMFVNNPASRLR